MNVIFKKFFQTMLFIIILSGTAGMALTYYKTWNFKKSGTIPLEEKLESQIKTNQ